MDELIKDEVQSLCSQLGVEYEDVIGKCRRHDLVMARVVMAEYLRQVLLFGVKQIGIVLNKDHSSVSYYSKVYIREYTYNRSFRRMADSVMKQD